MSACLQPEKYSFWIGNIVPTSTAEKLQMLELTSTRERLEHQIKLLHQTIERTCDALPSPPERPLKRPAATTPREGGKRATTGPARETAAAEGAEGAEGAAEGGEAGTPAAQPAAAAATVAQAGAAAAGAAAATQPQQQEVVKGEASRDPVPITR